MKFRTIMKPHSLFLRERCGKGCFLWGVLVLCLVVAVGGCQNSETPVSTSSPPGGAKPASDSSLPISSEISFQDITKTCGVNFTYRNGEESQHFSILESLGGGIGIIDLDHDGLEDLIIPGGGHMDPMIQPRGVSAGVFRNRGEFTFSSVADLSGVDGSQFYSHGTAVTDFNNDGFSDCLITGYGGLQLLINQGDGTFVEDSRSALLLDDRWSSSAAWADFNSDGASDLYVAHYVDWSSQNHPFCKGPAPSQREICPPRQFNGVTDMVYFSNGDGTFRDATREVGLSPEGKGLGVVAADLDGDHDVDVYVANDTVENFLYENDGGKFKDVSLLSGSSVSERGVPEGSMGVDAFDYNRDGRLDLWVVNYENESASLYENAGNLQFRHVSQRTGITAAGGGLFVGWGTCPVDVDLNGLEDIFISNGHVIRFPINAPVRQRPLLLLNQGGTRFRNVASTAGTYMTTEHSGRGAAVSDLNLDGRPDFVVSANNEPVAVLKNESAAQGISVLVELVGTRSPRIPIGTTVQLTWNGRTQTRQLKGGGSYASSNSPRIHFAIPEDSGSVMVAVEWPSGERQEFEQAERGKILRLIEGRQSPVFVPLPM